MNAVEIKNLSKTLDSFTLKIDNLNIKKGFVTGFIGPNGSGKTTTIRLIMDMLEKDNGIINIFGKEYKRDDLSIKECIGYVGDVPGYLIEAKLKDIKKSLSRFYKNWDENLYKKYMSKFGLNENKIYKKISKGQQKKFELVMALSHHPKLIIMDEPTANLDPLVRNEFLEILQETIENDEATVFYSTHITTDLEKVGDYIVFIYQGKIIIDGDKDSIINEHSVVRGKNNLLDKDTEKVFISINKNSFGFDGLVNNKKNAYELFGEEVIYDKPSLEEILMYYTRGISNE